MVYRIYIMNIDKTILSPKASSAVSNQKLQLSLFIAQSAN